MIFGAIEAMDWWAISPARHDYFAVSRHCSLTQPLHSPSGPFVQEGRSAASIAQYHFTDFVFSRCLFYVPGIRRRELLNSRSSGIREVILLNRNPMRSTRYVGRSGLHTALKVNLPLRSESNENDFCVRVDYAEAGEIFPYIQARDSQCSGRDAQNT